ncbi:MAG TPA: HAMP domain-containing sensor histidine kinase [Gaiella sp.]|nr:HAMP domain-containing sensor histidine kinase [Gaiella sp.]
MSLPGGIRTTLAVALLLIVGGALGGAYLMVVPSLERRLVAERLDELQSDAEATAYSYTRADARGDFNDPLAVDTFVDAASLLVNARVVVYQVFGPEPLSLRTLADSAATAGQISDDTVGLDTAQDSRITRGRVERRGRPFAEIAVPLVSGNVLLLSTPIEDQLATVRVVKRRMLYATGVALAIAAILGSAAATLHARRIRRLERAANRIAQGEFDEPVVDLGDDELGELAAAFERMRVQLAQLDTARKEFVANASHELRTPLFSLAGFLELMADEDLDEDTRAGFLVTTREQVDRLTKLAADLLDLSRMDAGRFRVEQEEVVLADAARTLVDELTPLAESTGHSLLLETDDRAWALADEERVLQIGRSLAVNALTHTPPGTEIVLTTALHGGRAELAVSDDGPGIPREHAERVFDRFYRIEGPHASGSGLGLAIARQLAERMGGTVELSGAAGRTTFTLSLPAATVPAGELAVST